MEEKLYKLLDLVKNKLPPTDTANIKEYIEHREWGLAFETLVVQLYEFNISISLKFYNEAKSIGNELGMETVYMDLLNKLIRD